ncbi:hypothetical protein [Microvirga splendida]|uniref:Uncharacterized protein n=1 Tax=Microvirga splendida TaxID=2795727 RepID=A0ABS0Y1R4_9HYPH|nr:hypothetical protein [Microvirga splendida]MBJ6126247.1 hypothetical protein [Microvirga splendida]
MDRWPVPGTQAWPTGWRLVVLGLSVAASIALALTAGWGFWGALVLSVIAVPTADLAFRRLAARR